MLHSVFEIYTVDVDTKKNRGDDRPVFPLALKIRRREFPTFASTTRIISIASVEDLHFFKTRFLRSAVRSLERIQRLRRAFHLSYVNDVVEPRNDFAKSNLIK